MRIHLSLWITLLLQCWLVYSYSTRNSNVTILFTEHLSQQPNRLTRACLENVPAKYRDQCNSEAMGKYHRTLYVTKRQCCARWLHINCLRPFVFNSIYCNVQEQEAMIKYLNRLRRTLLADIGECVHYPPIESERGKLRLGQSPRCQPMGIL